MLNKNNIVEHIVNALENLDEKQLESLLTTIAYLNSDIKHHDKDVFEDAFNLLYALDLHYLTVKDYDVEGQ